MSPDAKKTRDEILEETLELPPSEVPAFLDRVCGADSELRSEVERLLGVYRRMASGFMKDTAKGWAVPHFDRGDKIGRYEVESQLGAGGMSVVYRARDPGIGRLVAVKVLLPSGEESEAANRRFLAEVRILGSITHANVVQIFDFGELHGLPYIVMECLEGEDLAKMIAKGRCGDFSWKLDVARQLAQALDHVHRAGIIHRDIKPANVFIEQSGRVKLMDFGVARSGERRGTHATALIGTPEYLPPEQVKGESATQLSDVYSFGILLFELFTGTKPYVGNTAEVLYRIVHENIPIDVLKNAGIPTSLVKLICSATSKNLSQRPSSFAQICAGLDNMGSGPAVTRWLGLTMWLWKRRKVVAGVLTFVAALGAALTYPAIRSSFPGITPGPGPTASRTLEPKRVQNQEPPPEKSQTMLPASTPPVPSSSERRAPSNPPISRVAPAPPSATGPVSSLTAKKSQESDLPAPQVNPPPLALPAAAPPSEVSKEGAARAETVKEIPETTRKGVDTGALDPPTVRPLRPEEDDRLTKPKEPINRQVEARAGASARILALLNEYAAAFGSKNLSAVSSLRELTGEQRRQIARTFTENLKVEMTLAPDSEVQFPEPAFELSADTEPLKATISVDVTIRLRANNGEVPSPAHAKVTLGLTRTGQRWRIASWE